MAFHIEEQFFEHQAVYDRPSWFNIDEPDEFGFEGAVDGDINELLSLKATAIEFSKEFECAILESTKEECPPTMARETGDDKIYASTDCYLLCLSYAMTEGVLKMSLGYSDTFISTTHWDFCSVIGEIPCAIEQSYNYVRKTDNMDRLGFHDIFPLKACIDTAPSVTTFGDTAVGKATWLHYRKDVCRKELRGMLEVLSFFQDGMLRTDKMNDPKYIIPRCAGGVQISPNFNVEGNGYLYVRCFKNGTYQRIYGTATAEIMDYLGRIDQNRPNIQAPLICSKLRDKQEYLHGTYGGQVFVKERTSLPDPLYKGMADLALLHCVEQRLVSARLLIGRRGAEVELMRAQRLQKILFSNDTLAEAKFFKVVQRDLRKEYEGALSANSAFQRLLKRQANHHDAEKLMKEGWGVSSHGVREFSKSHAQFLTRKDKRLFTLRDMYFAEDMFVKDEISAELTLKVGGIPLLELGPRGKRRVETVTQIGLWQISSSMYDWCMDKVNQLTLLGAEHGRPLPHRHMIEPLTTDLEWVNDDLPLIERALYIMKKEKVPQRAAFFWLITKDGTLAHRLQKTVGIPVCLIAPDNLLQRVADLEELEKVDADWLDREYPYDKSRFRVSYMLPFDSGSVAHELAIREDNLRRKVEVVSCENIGSKRKVVKKFKETLTRPNPSFRWYF